MHLQEILKVFKEQDWEDELQIVIQCYGINELEFPSLVAQLLFLPETAKFYGLDIRMSPSEMIALFKKLDNIKRMLEAEVIQI